MARHRNVRAMNIDEEYEGYYDCYGHSVEDDFCISPGTEAEFLYDRNAKKHSMSAFLNPNAEDVLHEEEESGEDSPHRSRTDSLNGHQPKLSSLDKAKLQSCIEGMQNVVGDTISEATLSKAALDHNFNMEKALNAVLSGYDPKPQRLRRERRKEFYFQTEYDFSMTTEYNFHDVFYEDSILWCCSLSYVFDSSTADFANRLKTTVQNCCTLFSSSSLLWMIMTPCKDPISMTFSSASSVQKNQNSNVFHSTSKSLTVKTKTPKIVVNNLHDLGSHLPSSANAFKYTVRASKLHSFPFTSKYFSLKPSFLNEIALLHHYWRSLFRTSENLIKHIFDMHSLLGKNDSLGSVSLSNNVKQKSHIYLNLCFRLLNEASVYPFSKIVNELTEIEILSKFCGNSSLNEYLLCFLSNLVVHFNKVCDESKHHNIFTFLKESTDLLSQFQSSVYNFEFSELYQNCLIESLYSSFLSRKTKRKYACVKNNALIALQDINTVAPLYGRKYYSGKRTSKLEKTNKNLINEVKRFEKCIRTFFTDKIALFIGNENVCMCKKHKFKNHGFNCLESHRNSCICSLSFITTIFVCKQIICSLQVKNASSTSMHEAEFHPSNNLNMNKTNLPYKLQDAKCRNCGKVDFSFLSNLSKRYFEMKQLPSPKGFKIRNKNLHVNEIKNNLKHNIVNVDCVLVPSNSHAEVAPLHYVSNTLSDSKSIHNISSKTLPVQSHYIANNLKENSFNQCKNQNIKSSDCQQSMLNISNGNGSYEASNIKLPETTLLLNEPSLISHINVISLENQDEKNSLSDSSGSFMKSNSSEIDDILSELQRGSYVKEKSANNYEAVPSNVEHTVHLDFLNNDTLHKSTQSENGINDKEQFKDKCIRINNSKTSAESYNKTKCQSFENEIQLQEDLKRTESNLFTFALNDSHNKESKWASRMKNDDIVDEHLLNALLDDQLISGNYDTINNSSTEPVLHPNSNNDNLLTDFESIYFGSDELDLSQLSVKEHKTYSFRDQGKECGESNDIISKYLLTSICNNGETDSKSINNEISTSKECALAKNSKHSSKCNELLCQEDGTSKNINNLLNDPNTDKCFTENLIINPSVLQTNSKELSLDVGNSLPFNATEESYSLKDINKFDVTVHSSDSAVHQLQQINDMNTNKFHFSSLTDMSLLNILDIDSGSNALESSCFLSNNQTDMSPKSLTFLAQKHFENSDVINSNKEGKMLDLNQNCIKELLKCEETNSNSEMKSRNEIKKTKKKLLKEFSLADIYFSSQHKLHNDQSFEVENINGSSSMELLGFETMEVNCCTANGKQKQGVVVEPKPEVYDDENHFAHVIDLTTARKVNQDEMEGFNINFISRKSAASDLSKNITNDHINTKSILVADDVKGRNSLEKIQPSLFAKVLCSKFKPQQNLLLPKPPRSLKEILSSDRFCEKFSFNIPSPDDVAAEKQSKSFRTSGTTDKNEELAKPPPATDDVKDSPSFVQSGRLEFNTDETSIVDNLKKLSISKESSPENKNIPIEAESSQELSVNSSDINGIEDAGGKSSLNDTEQEKTVLKIDEINTISGESTPKPKSRNTEKDLFEAYKKERAGEKPLINLVVIGHVDAGKSTLMGHLLFRLGCVAKRTMHKYEQDSKKLGKASFMYAWVLDETSEERTRGITMDVAQSKFDTPHRSVTLLDAPGHKDFIPNMITGAAQADVAVLVVDATRGEFETGFETGGQTREHTLLVRSLGVSQLAVAVNKLDNVNWDLDRYKEIVSKLSSFLKQAGFKESDVQFVPCSGLTGENLINAPQTTMLKSWYTGPCLVDAIDNFKPPERPVSKPFRLCIGDVFKGMGGGFCVSGRIEAGFVQNADRVLVMPAGEQAIVKGITIDEASVTHAFAGDHVTLQLAGVDINKVNSGSVVCDTNQPVKVTTRFQARLVIFNIDVPITKGFPVILHYQSMSEQAVVHKLISQLHRSTGQVVKKKPRCLTKNSSAVIEVEVIRPICVELYKDFKDLGRFMLRSGGSTIAAGLVTEIL